MKKIALLLFLPSLLFIVGCSEEAVVQKNMVYLDELVSINDSIDEIKILLADSPDDISLLQQRSRLMFQYMIADAKFSNVRPDNEPFFLEGSNDVGIVLVHGFTASPWEVKDLAEYLNERGITVYAPLLSGHGTVKEHLARTEWQDWYDSVEESYEAMSYLADNVF